MNKKSCKAVCVVAISLISHLSLSAQVGKVAGRQREVALYNPYWSIENGFESTVQLHNNLVDTALTVSPLLYRNDGSEIQLAPINLPPLGNRSIALRAVLLQSGVSASWLNGSAVFKYSHTGGGALGAEISVIDANAHLAYTITSTESGAIADAMESVFVMPFASTEVYVAVQNISTHTIHFTPVLTVGGVRHPLPMQNLGAKNSTYFSIQDVLGRAGRVLLAEGGSGGLSLVHDGGPGAVVASGWLEDRNRGLSTMMTFSDPGVVHSKSLAGTQLFVGPQTGALAGIGPVQGHLVLRNLSGHSVSIRGTADYNQGDSSNSVELPISNLGPFEIRDVKLNELSSFKNLGIVASVRIEYVGAPGTVIGRYFGFSVQQHYGFYSVLEPFAPRSVSELYWTTENGWDSYLTVFNPGDHPDSVSVVVTYDGGTTPLPSVSLRSGESRTFNLREMQGNFEGVALARSGGFRIVGAHADSQLIVKEHLINASLGIASPFYGTPTYVVALNRDVATISVSIGERATNQSYQLYHSDNTSTSFCPNNLTSSNVAIATVDTGVCGGGETGVSPGQATITAQTVQISDIYGGTSTFTAQSIVNTLGYVQISSVSISPNSIHTDAGGGTTSSTITVQVYGSQNLGSTPQIKVSVGTYSSTGGASLIYTPSLSPFVSVTENGTTSFSFTTVSAGSVPGTAFIIANIASTSGGPFTVKDPNPIGNGRSPNLTIIHP